MSWVAVAIGASAAIGAGTSMYAGSQQADAAKGAAGAMSDANRQAQQTTIAAGRDALAYLDPYRQFGLNAGSSIQSLLYSPEQRLAQMEDQRTQLQGEVDRLKSQVPVWERYPIFTGAKASERRAAAFTEEYNIAQTKVAEAQAKLDTFNKQYEQAKAQAAQGPPKINASPWYQFQADLLGRNMDRFFAARGLTGSGFEAEERRRSLIELGAGETERQFSRMTSLFDTGAQAASAGAGAITGTAQDLAGLQVGRGKADAGGILGVGAANADMAAGANNQIVGATALYLANRQWREFAESLRARNNPNAVANDNLYNATDAHLGGPDGAVSPSAPYDYLRG